MRDGQMVGSRMSAFHVTGKVYAGNRQKYNDSSSWIVTGILIWTEKRTANAADIAEAH